MTETIRKQLEKCRVANIPNYDKNTTHIIIPKSSVTNDESFLIGHYYEINIDKSLVNDYSDNTLSVNWNHNTHPPSVHLNVCVNKLMGKMANVDCIGVDNGIQWSGWLPMKNIKIVKELTV